MKLKVNVLTHSAILLICANLSYAKPIGNTSMKTISTDKAPTAIGTYSQAVVAGDFVFVSGQIGLDPKTMKLVSSDFREQAQQVFKNLQAVTQASGKTLQDIVKLTVYITDLKNFAILNEVMSEFMQKPYPARAAVEVSALPAGATIEIDAIIKS